MASILDQHTNPPAVHDCGGTILFGGFGEQAHIYCGRCGAFSHDADDIERCTLPTGIDAEANRAALDDGDERSPEA